MSSQSEGECCQVLSAHSHDDSWGWGSNDNVVGYCDYSQRKHSASQLIRLLHYLVSGEIQQIAACTRTSEMPQLRRQQKRQHLIHKAK